MKLILTVMGDKCICNNFLRGVNKVVTVNTCEIKYNDLQNSTMAVLNLC